MGETREVIECPACSRPSERWRDDDTHPSFTEMKSGIACHYGPVYGWYWCKTYKNLLPLPSKHLVAAPGDAPRKDGER